MDVCWNPILAALIFHFAGQYFGIELNSILRFNNKLINSRLRSCHLWRVKKKSIKKKEFHTNFSGADNEKRRDFRFFSSDTKLILVCDSCYGNINSVVIFFFRAEN